MSRHAASDFGALSWRHEIAHKITGHGQREMLIADALLTYLAHGKDGQLTFHHRLLELDRATVPPTRWPASSRATPSSTAAKLPPAQSEPAWQARYPVFPTSSASSRADPAQRSSAAPRPFSRSAKQIPRLEVRVSLALLEDLQRKGPFAPIWHRPDDPARTDRPVWYPRNHALETT